MAIGTALAIGLGATALGAGASAISSNSASRRAANTSQRNTDANVNLAREIYGNNQQVLSPFVNRGNAAGDQINALLGLGGSQEMGGPAPAPNALTQFLPQNGGMGYNPAGYGDMTGNFRGTSMAPYTDVGMPYGLGDGFITTGTGDNGMLSATGNTMGQVPTQQTAQQAANSAFDTFRNSTGYQFRLGEGLDAVGSAYAGIGGLQSGAAMRGINEYGQNFASNEFGNYMNALGGQQAVGAGSASALAGVGQNFAGTVIGSNNQNAANQMNAQLGRQNVFANALGTIGGGILGYGR